MNAAFIVTPSFEGLSAASSANSFAKQINRSCDPSHERILRTSLWKSGLRYRKNVKMLPGDPDIVFVAARVAVFCDGDIWHGRDWRRLSKQLRSGANALYWIRKIKVNGDRDQRNEQLLEREGWTVIRLWETDIHRDHELAAGTIAEIVQSNRRGSNALH